MTPIVRVIVNGNAGSVRDEEARASRVQLLADTLPEAQVWFTDDDTSVEALVKKARADAPTMLVAAGAARAQSSPAPCRWRVRCFHTPAIAAPRDIIGTLLTPIVERGRTCAGGDAMSKRIGHKLRIFVNCHVQQIAG